VSELSVSIQIGDAVRVIEMIDTATRDASDLMKDVLLVMIRSTSLNFDAEGRPRWDDLKESTIRHRFALGAKGAGAKKQGSLAILGSITILRNTGLLAQSVGLGQSGSFQSGEGFGESDNFAAVIGTSQPGWQNQFPDTRGWRAAREFLMFQPQDDEDIAAMAQDWLLGLGPYARE